MMMGDGGVDTHDVDDHDDGDHDDVDNENNGRRMRISLLGRVFDRLRGTFSFVLSSFFWSALSLR